MTEDIEEKREVPDTKRETTVTPDASSQKNEVSLETKRSIARLIFGGFIKVVPDGRKTEK